MNDGWVRAVSDSGGSRHFWSFGLVGIEVLRRAHEITSEMLYQ